MKDNMDKIAGTNLMSLLAEAFIAALGVYAFVLCLKNGYSFFSPLVLADVALVVILGFLIVRSVKRFIAAIKEISGGKQ